MQDKFFTSEDPSEINEKLILLSPESEEYKFVSRRIEISWLVNHDHFTYGIKMDRIYEMKHSDLVRNSFFKLAEKEKYSWLFHGTSHASEILENGFRISETGRFSFGKGIYFAPSATKSCLFSNSNRSEGQRGQLLLSQVFKGNVWEYDVNKYSIPSGTHSVLGYEFGQPEFVIKDPERAFVRYLIDFTFTRDPRRPHLGPPLGF